MKIDLHIVVLLLIVIIIILLALIVNKCQHQKESYTSLMLTPEGAQVKVDAFTCNDMLQYRHTPSERIDNQGPVVGEYLEECNKVCSCNGGKKCKGSFDPKSVPGIIYDEGSC